MLSNYFKVAIRNILKYKFFSFINILGMTVGITCCLLISIYVIHELSYDRFHEKADEMYQVGLHGKIGGQDIVTATTCPPMAEAFAKEITGIKESTRIGNFWEGAVIKNGEKALNEQLLYYADSNFFSFFTYVVKEGDPKTALQEPNSVVLTESMVKKYFGEENAMGKMLSIGNDNRAYKVTAITEDAPLNSHFRYNMLLSSSSMDRFKSTEWLNNYLYTYVIIDKNADMAAIEKRFADMVYKYVGPEIERFMGVSIKEMEKQGGVYGYFVTPVPDIHLKSPTRDALQPQGNIMYVYIFGAIGIFIIVIACINFMNLATARSAGRAKEVGLRKTLGSLRGQMIAQFLSESMMYSFITVLLAVGLAYLLLPQFNEIAGKQLNMELFMNPMFILSLVALAVFVGLVAGSYPAFYLTSFNAVEVLKGKVRSGMKTKGVRSTLVVFQFALSIILIIFTAVVYQQINYMQNRNLGIDKHNVLAIQSTSRLGNNQDAFKTALEEQSSIVKASYTNNGFPGVNSTTVFKSAGSDEDHIMGIYYADYDHMDVMKFEMKDGRFFSPEFPSDSTAIVLNEAAVKEFGFKNPLEEELIYNGDGAPQRLRIIGVVKDFNFETLKEQVRPLSIRYSKKNWNLMIRYKGSASDAVATIEGMWKKYAANEPLEYTFLDQDFDSLFRSEKQMGVLFQVFSVLAIFIACLGLFALAAFTAEQRTKEIGIRKAMGATTSNLTLLISKEFIKLVLIAFIPAAGVAWYFTNEWLNGFAFHIDVSPLIFLGSGLLAIFIAWLTVSFQSFKAAASNPVDSLRYE